MDNLDPIQDNQDPQEGQQQQQEPQTAAPSGLSWKTRIGEDLGKSPSLSKFPDTEDGLTELSKSYANLEQLLGHEKVPIPKGPDDVEGMKRFNKALGVPDTAEGYTLPDATLPPGAEGLTFDKQTFAQAIHKHGLTPKQAEGLWKDYTELSAGIYQAQTQAFQDSINKTVNALRTEWGDAYGSKVELGQMIISKFAGSQEAGDYLTSTLAKSPHGIKFLATIGEQFSENKIGDFKYSNFAKTPTEAQDEYEKILSDPKHPYLDPTAPDKEHTAAVEYVNKLIATIGKGNKGQA